MDTLEIKPSDKIIVIIGLTASGKTTLTEKVVELCPDHTVFHTDDYMQFGFEQSLYKLISDIKADQNDRKIIEGVQGFRLLRKGLQNQDFYPDLVIHCYCDTEERIRRYAARGEGKKTPTGFDKSCYKIFEDYKALLDAPGATVEPRDGSGRPRFLNIKTD